MSEWHSLIKRVDAVLSRVEKLLPAAPLATDWKAIAFRWRKRNGHGAIDAVRHVHKISLADLCGIDGQKKVVEQNTRQFVDGHPANNVLLTGARGTGKSSLIKALLNKYAPRGLRVIEVEKQDLIDLPEIVELIAQRPERFVLYCDDLSFEADEPGYKALKVVLDGSVAAASENCLIYATSNRRHLMPEFMTTQDFMDEVHKIRCPALLIAPGDEPIGSISTYHEMKSKMPDAELIVYEGARHNINDYLPERCADDILKFLGKRFGVTRETGTL